MLAVPVNLGREREPQGSDEFLQIFCLTPARSSDPFGAPCSQQQACSLFWRCQNRCTPCSELSDVAGTGLTLHCRTGGHNHSGFISTPRAESRPKFTADVKQNYAPSSDCLGKQTPCSVAGNSPEHSAGHSPCKESTSAGRISLSTGSSPGTALERALPSLQLGWALWGAGHGWPWGTREKPSASPREQPRSSSARQPEKGWQGQSPTRAESSSRRTVVSAESSREAGVLWRCQAKSKEKSKPRPEEALTEMISQAELRGNRD